MLADSSPTKEWFFHKMCHGESCLVCMFLVTQDSSAFSEFRDRSPLFIFPKVHEKKVKKRTPTPFVGAWKHMEGEVQPLSENQQNHNPCMLTLLHKFLCPWAQSDNYTTVILAGQIVQCGMNISLLSEAVHSCRALEDSMSPSSSTSMDRTANFSKTEIMKNHIDPENIGMIWK